MTSVANALTDEQWVACSDDQREALLRMSVIPATPDELVTLPVLSKKGLTLEELWGLFGSASGKRPPKA